MKVVINSSHGGFTLSPRVYEELAKRKGIEIYAFRCEWDLKSKTRLVRYIPISIEYAQQCYLREFLSIAYFNIPNPPDYILDSEVDESAEKHKVSFDGISRTDSDLIEIIETIGEGANCLVCKPKIVVIPDGTDFEINEYDGLEWVAEKHQIWS